MTRQEFIGLMLTAAKVQPKSAPNFSDRDVVAFWFEALGHLRPEVLSDAIKEACRGNYFPSINDLLGLTGEVKPTEEEYARDAIQRIREAVGKFGSWHPKEAMQYIGPFGEHIVKTMGGWDDVCRLEDYELGIALAQAREYAKVAVKKQKAGILNEALPLPESKGLKLISDLTQATRQLSPVKRS